MTAELFFKCMDDIQQDGWISHFLSAFIKMHQNSKKIHIFCREMSYIDKFKKNPVRNGCNSKGASDE